MTVCLVMSSVGAPAFAADEGSVVGHVYGPDGITPLEGVRVSLVLDGELHETYTDSGGGYSFTGLRLWIGQIDFDPSEYNITHDPDLAPPPRASTVEPELAPVPHDVVLTEFGSIAGRLQSSDGESLQGIEVSVFSSRVSAHAYTDAGGCYEFDRLPPGTFSVRISAEEYNTTHEVQYQSVSLSFVVVSADMETVVDQTLLNWCSFSGHVTDPLGVACADARLYTVKAPYTQWSYACTTNAAGDYAFSRLEGSYRVKAVAIDQSLLPSQSDVISVSMASHAFVDFALRRGVSIRGRVCRPDGVPLENVQVVGGTAASGWIEDYTDASGAYELQPFDTGSYELHFDPTNYDLDNSSAEPDVQCMDYPGLIDVAQGGEAVEVDMTLPTCRISGRIVGPDGLPVEGLLVSAMGDYILGDAFTNGDGEFLIEDLSGGRYTVSVDAAAYNAACEPDLAGFTYYADVSVYWGDEQPRLEFTMHRAGMIMGHVYGSGGIPLAGVAVCADGPSEESTWSGPDGSFVISGLYPGWYALSYEASSYNESHDLDYESTIRPEMLYVGEGGVLAGADASLVAISMPPPVLSAVYRFYNVSNGTHFYTPSPDECAAVRAKWSNVFKYEGVGYYLNPANNAQPLYRFYNRKSQSHFYTASDDEAATVLATLGGVFAYEGRTYAVNPTEVPNSIPVYRFYNKKNASHFYTASVEERDSVAGRLSAVYTYEGPAFWIGQ